MQLVWHRMSWSLHMSCGSGIFGFDSQIGFYASAYQPASLMTCLQIDSFSTEVLKVAVLLGNFLSCCISTVVWTGAERSRPSAERREKWHAASQVLQAALVKGLNIFSHHEHIMPPASVLQKSCCCSEPAWIR